uniref:Uncharacterized protein n=1 Tax=Timema shepardi TaxID=629360 RepID=A0A7R9BC61_TIMSH|nr:unnamed protein product [Timema shepardi]
MGARPPSLSTC